MTSARRLDGYTLEDWERLEPAEGHRVELVEGRLVVSAAPAVAHQRVADRLCRLLDDEVAGGGMEAVTAVGVRIAPGLGYIPDVVVCTELVETTAVEAELVALAVEVVSPSTARRDRLEKPAAFAAAGVPAFWRVEIGRENGPIIYCYRLDQGVYAEVATLHAGVRGTVDVPGGGTVTFDPGDLIGSRRPRS